MIRNAALAPWVPGGILVASTFCVGCSSTPASSMPAGSDASSSTSSASIDASADGDDATSDVDAAIEASNLADSGPIATAELVVDPTVTYQTMDGFGASDAFTPNGSLTTAQAQLFFDPVNGIGLSMLRIGIDVDGLPLGSATLADVQLAASYGATVWATPWSPAPADKDNGSEDNGGHLCAAAGQGVCTGDDYAAWATVLAGFPGWLQTQTGVSLYAISAQNEPDYPASYSSCLYTGAEMVAFAKVLGPELAALTPPVKFIAAEPEAWSHLWAGLYDCTGTNDYGPCIHGDPDAEGAIDIFATHDYGLAPAAPPAWVTKPIWETEVSGIAGNPQVGPSVDIANGVAVAGWIYNAIVTGNASAWHYWWLVASASASDNEGLLFATGYGPGGVGDVGSPPKRLYALGNFSKFVRPGYQRIGASGTLPSGVQAVAFDQPTDGTTVVVAINASQTPTSISVSGATLPATMTPWVTSDSADLAAGSAIAVDGGGFTAVLDAMSVTTFVGKP